MRKPPAAAAPKLQTPSAVVSALPSPASSVAPSADGGTAERLHPDPFHSYQLPNALSAKRWPFCATSRLVAEPPAADWPFRRIEKPPGPAAPKLHTPSAVVSALPSAASRTVPSDETPGLADGAHPDPFHSYQLPNALSANRCPFCATSRLEAEPPAADWPFRRIRNSPGAPVALKLQIPSAVVSALPSPASSVAPSADGGTAERHHPDPFHSYQLPNALSAKRWPFCATSRLVAEPPAADWPFRRIEKPPGPAAPKLHTPS